MFDLSRRMRRDFPAKPDRELDSSSLTLDPVVLEIFHWHAERRELEAA